MGFAPYVLPFLQVNGAPVLLPVTSPIHFRLPVYVTWPADGIRLRGLRAACTAVASYVWGQGQQPPRRADPADAITVWSCKFGRPRRLKKKFVCKAPQTNPVCWGRIAFGLCLSLLRQALCCFCLYGQAETAPLFLMNTPSKEAGDDTGISAMYKKMQQYFPKTGMKDLTKGEETLDTLLRRTRSEVLSQRELHNQIAGEESLAEFIRNLRRRLREKDHATSEDARRCADKADCIFMLWRLE